MIQLDPANLPAELWAIDRTRVRAGKGPVRVVPARVSITSIAGEPCACGVETAGGRYYSRDSLYATEAEAKRYGQAMAVLESRDEKEKHRIICERLNAAYKACRPTTHQ